jgi:hypothetical protein
VNKRIFESFVFALLEKTPSVNKRIFECFVFASLEKTQSVMWTDQHIRYIAAMLLPN